MDKTESVFGEQLEDTGDETDFWFVPPGQRKKTDPPGQVKKLENEPPADEEEE